MLTTKSIEKAIEMFEGGAIDSAVAEGTGISPEEATAVGDALYVGETERLLREVTLAGVLEAASHALRSGQGLIGDTAGDLVREIWRSFPNAGLGSSVVDQNESSQAKVTWGDGTREDKQK